VEALKAPPSKECLLILLKTPISLNFNISLFNPIDADFKEFLRNPNIFNNSLLNIFVRKHVQTPLTISLSLADKFSIYVNSKESKLSEIKITGAEASSAVFMFSISKSSNILARKP